MRSLRQELNTSFVGVLYGRISVHTHVRIYVIMCICICMCISNTYRNIYIYTYIFYIRMKFYIYAWRTAHICLVNVSMLLEGSATFLGYC